MNPQLLFFAYLSDYGLNFFCPVISDFSMVLSLFITFSDKHYPLPMFASISYLFRMVSTIQVSTKYQIQFAHLQTCVQLVSVV